MRTEAVLGLILLMIFLTACSEITGNVVKDKVTYTFTSQCTHCDSSDDCNGACDSFCVEHAYEGAERASGYDKSGFLGLSKEVTCTCTCYKYD